MTQPGFAQSPPRAAEVRLGRPTPFLFVPAQSPLRLFQQNRRIADVGPAPPGRWWQLRAHVGHWFANALIPKTVEPLSVLVTEMRGKRSFVEQGSA